ncbi:unnamed protein product [Gordionus sp. m RMFG-2023]|uniref:hillarin-like isoform X2 n=1 Tax=Gordionus sp. m RMFG-2023 TaxID=3053472 RepID=UPI0030DFF83F
MVMHKGPETHCQRCNVKVYPVDKIGPLKGAFFHHQCFKCRNCGLSLNMKNFIQNQLDPDDKEVYCNNHVPKSLAGHVGGDAIGIRSALSAPRKGASYNEQIRGSDKYNPDTQAVEIQNALMNMKVCKDQDDKIKKEKLNKSNKWCKEDQNIKYLNGNHNINNNHDKLSSPTHNNIKDYNNFHDINYLNSDIYKFNQSRDYNSYSPDIYPSSKIVSHDNRIKDNYQNGKTHSPINNFLQQNNSTHNGLNHTNSPSPSDDTVDYESQIDLEKRLRAEEDEMYATFARKRLQEEKNLDAKFKEEFHKALAELREKFEQSSSPHSKMSSEPSPSNSPISNIARASPCHSFVKKPLASTTHPSVSADAIDMLEKRMTIKRDREKDALSRVLVDYERTEAARLMENHASQMLRFTTLRSRKKLLKGDNDAGHTGEYSHTPNGKIGTGGGGRRKGLDVFENLPLAKNAPVDSSINSCTKGSEQDNKGSSLFNINTEAPAPKPPKCLKAQLYSDPSIFEEIDQRAINIASKNQNSFTDLVRQLTRHCNTDVQKARALFRWITIINLNRMTFDSDVGSDTPMGLLRGIKLGTESYHMLFKRLCSYAGLHCVVIRGYSKSAGYLPGMKFEMSAPSSLLNQTPSSDNLINSKRFRNTWNAAYLDGSWRFVQCNWGARHLVNNSNNSNLRGDDKGKENATANGKMGSSPEMIADDNDLEDQHGADKNLKGAENLRYEYDDHYFLTDPEEFIYEFFPKQSEWQLLDTCLSLQQFENLPFVRSLFFKYGLSFSPDPNQGNNSTNSIHYSSPNHSSLSTNDCNYNHSTFKKTAFFNVKGAILLADKTGAANLTLEMPDDLVASLVFHYNLRFYHHPSPSTTNNPNLNTSLSSNKSVETTNGYATPNTLVTGNGDSLDGINMRRYVMQTLVGKCVIFKVHCPSKGEFLLDIFANQVNSSDYASGKAMRFKSVCKAKIVCSTLDKIMIPLPDCASGEWGPVKAYKLFTMIPASHEDAVVNTHTSFLVIRFCFAPLTYFSPRTKRSFASGTNNSDSRQSDTANSRRKLVDFAAALHKNDGEQTILSKCVRPRWIYTRDNLTSGEDHQDAYKMAYPRGRLDNYLEGNGKGSREEKAEVEGISFEVSLPEEGQYGLDIYAREEDNASGSHGHKNLHRHLSSPTGPKEKQLLTHACKYLINYRLA